MAALKRLVDRLAAERGLPDADMLALLACGDGDVLSHLFARARAAREAVYGRDVYIRGLIEFTNFCKNDCLYCGIRRSNARACRYRLAEEEILLCAEAGYRMGFRTVVLQGGEDPWFTDERLCRIVRALKAARPDRAVTLSVGERSRESYQKLFDAGADRYLLRHETATKAHYGRLHPPGMSFENRMRCLADLKAIGYQVGCGFMVGSPGQTLEDVARDLEFIRQFGPEMVGIGPFIPHRDTPLGAFPSGTVEMTCKLLAIIRLLLPDVLLARDHGAGHARPPRLRKGHAGRGERGDAQPLAAGRAGKVRPLRGQGQRRGRDGGRAFRPEKAHEKHRLPRNHRARRP